MTERRYAGHTADELRKLLVGGTSRTEKAMADLLEHVRELTPDPETVATMAAMREALRHARQELWDALHSHMSEEAFKAEPVIEEIDGLLAKVPA